MGSAASSKKRSSCVAKPLNSKTPLSGNTYNIESFNFGTSLGFGFVYSFLVLSKQSSHPSFFNTASGTTKSLDSSPESTEVKVIVANDSKQGLQIYSQDPILKSIDNQPIALQDGVNGERHILDAPVNSSGCTESSELHLLALHFL